MARQTYLIALGGNVYGPWGSPQKLLVGLMRSPIESRGDVIIVTASRIFQTPPLGPSSRRYANAVARVATDLSPPALLGHLKSIERAYGRRASRRWGARPLDLDIVGWSGGTWTSRTLTIPHPAFRQRRFVLAPLVEIAPDWRDPVTYLTARHLLARLDRQRPRA